MVAPQFNQGFVNPRFDIHPCLFVAGALWPDFKRQSMSPGLVMAHFSPLWDDLESRRVPWFGRKLWHQTRSIALDWMKSFVACQNDVSKPMERGWSGETWGASSHLLSHQFFLCPTDPSCAYLLKRSRFQPNAGNCSQPNAGNCSKPKTHGSHWPHLSRCISGRTGAEAPGLGFRAARKIQNEEPRQKSGGPDLQFLAKFNFNNVELFSHWTHQNILTIDAEGAEATGHPGFPHDRSPRVMATRDHPNPA